MASTFVGKIHNHFENVSDSRVNRGDHYPLIKMMFVVLFATVCDCNAWTDVAMFGKCKLAWFRKFLPFKRGIPAHDTFSDVFARLDSVEFYAVLEPWTMAIAGELQGEHALRGETVALDKGSSQSVLHSVSACGLRMCIGLKPVDDKSNETPAVQQLIDRRDLAGAIITADAMHCQRETAGKIIGKKADYVLMVKGNQEMLQAELQATIIQAFEEESRGMRQHKKTEKNRNRLETREITVIPVPKDSRYSSVGLTSLPSTAFTAAANSPGGGRNRRSISSSACRAKYRRLVNTFARTGAVRTRGIMCSM